jgi:xanthosine utilization system XapX-like protein
MTAFLQLLFSGLTIGSIYALAAISFAIAITRAVWSIVGLSVLDQVADVDGAVGVGQHMSIHICSNCGHEEHIFGAGGAEKMCKDFNAEFLGALPLDIRIREQTDSGKPTVVADPDGRSAEIYRRIARRVAVKISEQAKDMTSKFPNIVIQNT